MSDQPSSDRALKLAADIVAAHLGHNRVATDAVPDLIQSVFRTLVNIESPVQTTEAPVPAVAIRKSIFPDYIICLEDGKKLKTIKRHLMSAYGMNPDQYREKWGLPASYPMVAPNYAQQRSSLAKSIGLGRKRPSAEAAPGTDHKNSDERRPEPTVDSVFASFPAGATEPVEAKVATTVADKPKLGRGGGKVSLSQGSAIQPKAAGS